LASPEQAAAAFVIAINAGSAPAAEAVSARFSDGARQAATSGADPGISYSAGSVVATGPGATAVLVETLNVAASNRRWTTH